MVIAHLDVSSDAVLSSIVLERGPGGGGVLNPQLEGVVGIAVSGSDDSECRTRLTKVFRFAVRARFRYDYLFVLVLAFAFGLRFGL